MIREDQDILVGVNYFAGWWEPLPNKWHGRDGKDWRPNFPERVPLLGEYNNPATMQQEIDTAADHGVDFFAMLWYYMPGGIAPEPNAEHLERGLLDFMDAPNADRMKFYVEFCNHPPYDVTTEVAWEECIQTWLKAFAHPSYLRIDGKLVFKVHGEWYFFKQNGKDLERCRAKLDRLRTAVRDAGLGEMLIGCGVMSHEHVGGDHRATKLFDFTSTYMDLPRPEQKEDDYPYSMLFAHTSTGWAIHAKDAMPHMPHVAAGWCPRPWPDPRAYFALPSRDQWTHALRQMKAALQQHDALGLPGQKAFTIYAWNEYGEGGFIAPTQGDQYLKLECIQEVFGE